MDVLITSWRYTVCIYNVRLGISMGYSIYMSVLVGGIYLVTAAVTQANHKHKKTENS